MSETNDAGGRADPTGEPGTSGEASGSAAPEPTGDTEPASGAPAEAGGAAFAPALGAIATATTERHAFHLVVSLTPPVRAPAIGPPLILLKHSFLI